MDKSPPNSPEAENGLLACILLDPSVFDEAVTTINADMFYDPYCSTVFESMSRLAAESHEISEITVLEQLKRDGHAERVGLTEIYKIQDAAETTLQAKTFTEIILDKYRLRSIARVGREAAEAAYSEESDSQSVISVLESSIIEINKDAQEDSSIAKSTVEVWQEIEDMKNGVYVPQGLSFGIPTIDEHLPHGMEPGTITVLSAPSSCGKSQAAINVAMRHAIQDDMAVGYCSYEMLSKQLTKRMLRISSGVDLNRVVDGVANKSDLIALEETKVKLEKCKVLTDHKHHKVEALSSLARQWKRKHGIGLLIIDYLQLLDAPNSKVSSVEAVAHNSRALKRLALELEIPLIVLSQVNKEAEKRLVFNPEKGLHHQDLIGSSSIFQDADNILMFWPKDGDPDESRRMDTKGEPFMQMVGNFAKEREGTRGKRFDFKFIEQKGRFQ